MSKKGFKIQTLSVYMSTTLVLILMGMMGILLVVANSLSGQIRKNITVSVIIDGDTEEDNLLSKIEIASRRREEIKCGIHSSRRDGTTPGT